VFTATNTLRLKVEGTRTRKVVYERKYSEAGVNKNKGKRRLNGDMDMDIHRDIKKKRTEMWI
jgi:hypothetical protein